MSDNDLTIEVNGVEIAAEKGQMLIEATDRAGIYIPRFCYHSKLSIAANCRMCLVEVEKARKPMPACATPVADGMKVYTHSAAAISAQRATMEFLLINHPLDCPICDQGGECELQDLAMGFGRDASRYTEKKRVVKDKNLGPLVSTDMTRCIHCTRCVRFGQEIAGIQELGTLGRSEHMEIGTYIQHSVDHEMSGNIIDLCPVGALNSKPFRFRARSWEMTQHETVSAHDSIGSNLYAHVLRGRFMRVVPRPNDDINETWISDRDRFSYDGVYGDDRLMTPLIKRDGDWHVATWEAALAHTVKRLAKALDNDPGKLGMLAAPGQTVEEHFLFARIAEALGTANIDHRLRMTDFSDQGNDPLFPWLGIALTDIDQLDAALVVGSNLRHEAPVLAHRYRTAAINGASVSFLNPAGFDYLFPVANYLTADAAGLAGELAALLTAAGGAPEHLPAATVCDAHRRMVDALKNGERRHILLGHLAMRHPQFSLIRMLAAGLAEQTGATLGFLPEGANSVGASLVGALPHRSAGGTPRASAGLDARAMLAEGLNAYVLLGLEPEADCAVADEALATLAGAEFVVSLTPFMSDAAREYADVCLPIGTFAETAGTFVNLEGRWQSYQGFAQPIGEARPGWKVLRVLANMLELEGFDYATADQVTAAARAAAGDARPDNVIRAQAVTTNGSGSVEDVPMYQVDAIVRRSPSLQQTKTGQTPRRTY